MIKLDCSQASDISIQNKIRDCLLKFNPEKNRCGIKVPVLAAVKSKNFITYVKFGEQFCVGDITGASKALAENSFDVNLKSLVS